MQQGLVTGGLALCLGFGPPLAAQTVFVATLDGAQQVPPVATTASGTATLSLNATQDALSYSVTLTGLDLDGLRTPGDPDDDVVGLHFHRAAAGANGPVVFGLISPGQDGDDLTIDALAGTVSGIWEESDAGASSPLSAELVNLLADGLYLNVHTAAVGSGEIRGQVLRTLFADGCESGDISAWSSMSCGNDPGAPGGSCPAECTGGCFGDECLIACSGPSACASASLVCPADFRCTIQCSDDGSCSQATVVCPSGFSCVVECNGAAACADATIQCPVSAPCDLFCLGPADSCDSTRQVCGLADCEAVCRGPQAPIVECGRACSCSSNCTP